MFVRKAINLDINSRRKESLEATKKHIDPISCISISMNVFCNNRTIYDHDIYYRLVDAMALNKIGIINVIVHVSFCLDG